jgi:hypothetical protein
MAFMRPEITHGQFYAVETADDTQIIPLDVCGIVNDPRDLQSYCQCLIDFDDDIPAGEQVPEVQTGWLARLSAPGYLDCTDWTAHASEALARAYLADMYGDDEEGQS